MKESPTEHFLLSSNTVCGAGSASRLGPMLAGYGFRRIGVIIDQGVARYPPAQTLLDQVRGAGLDIARVYEADSSTEPTYSYLDEVAEEFRREEYDALVGIGGGSALDLAKGVGVLQKNAGRGIEYRGMNKVPQPGVPVVLAPTTAGTGSEVTHTASFIDTGSRTKLGINGRHLTCLFSVLDPALLVTCPRSVTIGAGLDALVHAIEGVTCRSANSVSRLFGREAVRLMLEALPRAAADQFDLEALHDTLLASHYAGLSMANAGGGPASGISYPLGVHYGVPHGLAGGLLLPHVVEFNAQRGYCEGYAELYDALPVRNGCSSEEKAARFAGSLHAAYEAMQAPRTFEKYGVTRAAIPFLTKLTMEQRRANLDLNPVAFGESDVVALLERVLI